MLTPSQIARTLNFDAILDLVEAAESTLCAHRAAFTPASPADGLETMTRALALLDRTASIRKTLAQIHATFTQPLSPTPNTSTPTTTNSLNDREPETTGFPLSSNLQDSAAALDQFQKLLGENADVTRELEQLITHLQKDADDPIPTESVMQFIKTMDLDSLDSLDSTDPLDPTDLTSPIDPTQHTQFIKSMQSIGSLADLNPLAALGPLSPLPPLAPLRIPRNATSPFDFTNIAPVAPYTPPKPAQPQSPAFQKLFAAHVPTIKAYAPRSCRVLPWDKLPHYAAETATRAEKLAATPMITPPDPIAPTDPAPACSSSTVFISPISPMDSTVSANTLPPPDTS